MTYRMLLLVFALALVWLLATPRRASAPVAGLLMAQNSGEPRRLGPDLHPPRLRKKIEPQYTEAARDAKLEGAVLLDGVVSTEGSVTGLRVRRGLGLGLDEKALEAVATWEFEPARQRKDNTPVPVQVTIEVNFRLL